MDVHKTSLPLISCLKCPTFVGLHLCMLPHATLRRISLKPSALLFLASNPMFQKGDKVKMCVTKDCQKRATEPCYSCKEVALDSQKALLKETPTLRTVPWSRGFPW